MNIFLLEIELFLHCSYYTSIDCSRIERFEVKLSNQLKLRDAALFDELEMSRTSLEDLVLKYLGFNLNKT